MADENKNGNIPESPPQVGRNYAAIKAILNIDENRLKSQVRDLLDNAVYDILAVGGYPAAVRPGG